MRRTTLTAAFAGLLLALAACSTNPATGKRSFTLLSWDEERQLGAEAAPQFTQEFGGPVGDPIPSNYVRDVGNNLLGGIEPGVPPLDWQFTLLDSEVINAFALPGGKVFFSRGLAARLENEAQMAGVVGHEIGHVTARHGNQRISAQMGMNIALVAGAVAVGVSDEDSVFHKYGQYGIPALAIGGNVILLKYGRSEELEADALGMRYMARAKYDPAAQRRVMEILEEASGPNGTPEILSTHPYPESRIKQIDKLMDTEYAYVRGDPTFRLNDEQYRQRMLEPLAKLPPPKHGAGQGQARFDLANPVTWCAHCAEEAASAQP